MAKRDPHDVLGIEPGATPTQIKAAWRRLARTHHPDLTGDDPAASQRATRRMAEINSAYAELTRDGGAAARRARSGAADGAADVPSAGATRRGGPPKAKATRPVTGRVDLSDTVRPRNQTIRPDGASNGSTLRGHAPYRPAPASAEPPRASTPTGPLARSRVRGFRRPATPPLDEAFAMELPFGKFHGHTLGQVAAFEPSYIDWLATTITRDPDLLAAARAVRDELDRQGVVRRARADLANRRAPWPMP
ncbi:MAG TPA: J domain-containing protein, partial [Candidatus Limnocylindrales bacterium]|nr:J domain-containing protein [Candidatus Limnocylindrales bacterium]